MNPSQSDPDRARTELYDIMQREQPFEKKAQMALKIGRDYLGVTNAHLARIDQEADFWEAIVSTDDEDGDIPPGLVLDYETTYCRRSVATNASIALHDAPNQGWADDPAYETLGLRCYVGVPVTVNGELYGTVCFVDEAPRPDPFEDRETMFVELVARLLEHELERTRAEDELALQSGLITVLSRVLRHNLRNDLNVVRGHLAMVDKQTSLASGLYETAKAKINELIELADTARELETIAGTEPDRRPVELTRLLEELVTGMQAEYEAASFRIDSPDDVTIEAFPTLRRAFKELIENAAKHGGDSPTVEIELEEIPDGVRLEIRDDGPGLPDQELAVLDEGTEKPLVHGSGLGLWLTYWIVSEHDGIIQADVTDAGTRITIELPRVGTPVDVTDYESMQRLFHREQDRFEAVFEESFDAIVVTNDDGRYIEVNDAASELFGLPEDELLGRRIDEFAPDDFDFQDAWERFRAAKHDQGTFPLVRPDGSERVVEYSATADIIPGQHLSVLRDVTDREERERRYRAIFDNAYQFMGLLDAEGRILEANRPALEFADLEADDVIGEKMWTTYWFQQSDETAERARAAVKRASDGEFARQKLTVQGADEDVVIDFSVRPVTDEDDQLVYLVPEGRDISNLDDSSPPVEIA